MISYRIDSDFYGSSRKLIVAGEGFGAGKIYADSVHLPTIGYGHALVAKTTKNNVTTYSRHEPNLGDFSQIGIALTDEQNRQLNAIIKNLNEGKFAEADALTVVLDAGIRDISEPEASTLYRRAFDRALVAVQNQFKSILGAVAGAQLFAEMSGTTEMIAIASLGYNNPGLLIGKGITNALWQGNRAEAWYEIRYGSNAGASDSRGIAKRRYAEAGVFGLYENPSAYANPSVVASDDAKQIYRMYQLHRAQIDNYELQYGDRVGFANTEFHLVGTTSESHGLINSLIPAQTALFAWLRSENPSLADAHPENYLATNVYLDPGRDAAIDPATKLPIAFDLNHAGYLYATKFDSQNNEIASNDILIGEGGDDYLLGGKGDDILLGGAGYDTYYFRAGDGNDRIIDSDMKGRIVIIAADGQASSEDLIPKTFIKQLDGSYLSPDGKIRLLNNTSTTLRLQDGSSLQLGDNFQSGDLGINLTEASTGGPIIRGDLKPIDHDITTPAEDLQYDSLGNVVVSTAEAPGREDRLYGAEIADTLLGLEGNDIINGKGDADLMEGGTGSDILIGDAGNDMIYGLSGPAGSTPLATALASGESDTNQDARGDWVDGQTGDDILVGTAAQDLLTGGTDNDLLIGGAGNDLLLGDAALAQAWPDWNVDRRVEPDAETNSDLYRWTITRGSTTESDSIGGADVLYGGKGEDWLLGGAGDDLLDGAGDDGQRDHDLDFGNGDRLVIRNGELDKVQAFQFADGTTPTTGELLAAMPRADLLGEAGADFLQGHAGGDALVGQGGDDTLLGSIAVTPHRRRTQSRSRRWRHGERNVRAGNDTSWRSAA